MQEELETIQELHKTGKLDKRLVWRMVILFFVSIITFGILSYDLFFENLEILPTVGFAIFGFILGFYIFVRMNKVTWDNERQIVAMGRFDFVTIVLIILYVLYRIGIDKYLEGQYDDAFEVSAYSLATLFGGMLGRFLGTLYAIDKSHKEKK